MSNKYGLEREATIDYPFYKFEGKEERCVPELIIASLLIKRDGNLQLLEAQDYDDGAVTAIYVNANDMFAWGCADAEPLPYSELANFWRACNDGTKWGSVKWMAKRRNQKPQGPVCKAIKKDGEWDDEWEAIGENTMDKEVHDSMREALKGTGYRLKGD